MIWFLVRTTISDCTFPVAAARVWNSLPSSQSLLHHLRVFCNDSKLSLLQCSYIVTTSVCAAITSLFLTNYDVVVCSTSSGQSKVEHIPELHSTTSNFSRAALQHVCVCRGELWSCVREGRGARVQICKRLMSNKCHEKVTMTKKRSSEF